MILWVGDVAIALRTGRRERGGGGGGGEEGHLICAICL